MYDEGNREIRGVKTITSSLSFQDWADLTKLARKNSVPIRDYIRGIIVDVLEEERELELQRSGTQASTPSGEAGEANGETTA